jgi:hypothetical protein
LNGTFVIGQMLSADARLNISKREIEGYVEAARPQFCPFEQEDNGLRGVIVAFFRRTSSPFCARYSRAVARRRSPFFE